MKKNTLFLTTALMSLMLCQPVIAQQAASPTKTPAGGASAPASVAPQLSPEKEAIYKTALDQLRVKNNVLRDQIEKLQQEASTIMTADTFDKAAYIAKNAEIEKVYAQMHTNTSEAIAGVASQFTADERRIIEKQHQAHSSVKFHSVAK